MKEEGKKKGERRKIERGRRGDEIIINNSKTGQKCREKERRSE